MEVIFVEYICMFLGHRFIEMCGFLLKSMATCINTLGPRQNGRHFPNDIFKYILLKENIQVSIKISLKFVRESLVNNIPALVQIMAWRRPGDKPLFEPMVVSILTHICVTRPQWVNVIYIMLYQYLPVHVLCGLLIAENTLMSHECHGVWNH